ncbi:hypothetical protein ACIRSS_11210 [Amycolatopsis sp. NPDC101161]|uniref:hypothetical protein n=1 Tax=Amycolatopsis sp. NPDC101161 TaxID=3363940 RepID=UPI0037FF2B4E
MAQPDQQQVTRERPGDHRDPLAHAAAARAVAARRPGRGLARTAAVAITPGTVTAVCSGLGAAVLAGPAATLLGLVLIAAVLGKRQRRLVRLGLLAVALSRTFRPATWLTTFL